jgi:hypothetical protein
VRSGTDGVFVDAKSVAGAVADKFASKEPRMSSTTGGGCIDAPKGEGMLCTLASKGFSRSGNDGA